MDTRPVAPWRRRVFEGLIRVVDLVVYAAVFLGGVAVLFVVPASVRGELGDQGGLIALWSALLVGGGLVGFLGRLTRYWLVEQPGPVAGFFGAMIYFVVLGKTVFDSVGAAVAAAMVLVAAGCMVRRWAELQLFGSEPDRSWRVRLRAVARRRTKNVVDRTYS